MNFESLYKQDAKNIISWQKGKFTKKEFISENRKLRKELDELIRKKKILTSREHFISAMVYHHGFTLSSSKKALKHIRKAQKKDYLKQKWLLASIIDRLLQLQGKPQKYGTQAVELKNGKFKVYKLDGTISDKERSEMGLPILKKLKRYLER